MIPRKPDHRILLGITLIALILVIFFAWLNSIVVPLFDPQGQMRL